MPIKATETDDFESDQPEDDSDEDDDVLEDDKLDDDEEKSPEETLNGDGFPDDKARDLRLMHLRKGFRLSSMCWDD